MINELPIGQTVRVIRVPKSYPSLQKFAGFIGTVSDHYPEDGFVAVRFGPPGTPDWCFRPTWLNRGTVQWIPEGMQA